MDSDNNAATGCTLGGMTGVDDVLVTLVRTDATSGAVERSYRLECTGGSFGSQLDVDTTGWAVGYNPANGSMTVENRIAYATLGGLPAQMRLLFDGNSGGAVHSSDVVQFPGSNGKRRSVGSSGPRVFVLDGNSLDWAAITPLDPGMASRGSRALRVTNVYAFANATDSFLYFRFDANVSSDAPFAEDDTYSRTPGQNLSVPAPGVLANDGDPNGQPITALPVSPATNGNVVLNADGSFTYAPNDPASSQSDSFQYKATNGTQDSNVAKVTINVSAVANHAPASANDSYSTNEDSPLNVGAPGVLGNDTDLDGDTLTATKLTDPSNGTVVVSSNGSFTYTPDPNFFGTDTFTYTVSDGELTATATVTITISPVNDPPATSDVACSVDENAANGTVVCSVTASDVEGDTVSFAITAGNGLGAFTVNSSSGQITVADGTQLNFEATPAITLTVTVTDSNGDSSNATVTISLNDLNDAPVATGDAATTAEDTPLTVAAPGVLANDSDEDGDTMTAVLVTGPANAASFALNPNGGYSYTPNANFFGTDSFTYQASDGSASSNVVTVVITVTAVNDTPSFTAGPNVSSPEDTPYSAGWATAISAGPANESGQTLTFNVSNNNNGLFSVQPSITAAGVLSFTPALDAFGSATVTVTLSDNGGGANTTAPVNFTITITEVNDPPVANADAITTAEDTPNAFAAATLTVNDSKGPANESAQTLTVTGVSATSAQGGTVTLVAGTVTYTPPANYSGADSFTYTVTDNGTTNGAAAPLSAVGTVNVTVTAVNDAPVNTVPAAQNINEDVVLVFSTGNGNAISVSDVDAGTAPFRATLTVTNGTVTAATGSGATLTGNGTASLIIDGTLAQVNAALNGLTFTPTANYPGPTATVQLVSSDLGATGSGGTLTDTDSVTINITAVNDAPVFTPGPNVTVNEDSGAYSNGWATAIGPGGGADEVGQTVSFNVSNDNNALFTGGGQPALSPTGVLTFTPAVNAFGTATVTVSLTDNGSGVAPNVNTSASVQFTITVTAVNDAPVVTTTGGTTPFVEDAGAVAVDAGVTITDVDSPTLAGATVTITNLLDAGVEVLAAPTLLGGVTANYIAPTLTLSGTATLADYQAMLQAVTYLNNSNNPTTTNRVVSFQVNDGAGVNNLSNVANKTVSVTATNDAPVVTTSVGTTAFTEDGPAVAVDGAVTVTDVDNTTIASATVTITNLLDAGQELLAAPTLLGGATANYVAPTLTISGTTTLANYQAMLAAVTYNNTSQNPNTTNRVLAFVANDGTTSSAAANKTVSITPVNDAPVVTTTGGNTAFVEDAGAVAVDGGITVTDIDSATLASATITISNLLDAGQETLAAPTLLGAATANYVAPTLTISGVATVAEYQSMLAAVTYNNTSNNPDTTVRVINFQVNDGAGVNNLSNVGAKNVSVAQTNDAPVVTTTGGTTSFTEDNGAVVVDSGVTVTDVDNTTIASATVTITNLLDAGQEVLAAPTLLGGATANYVAPTLTISGTTSVANYQSMLAAVTYNNTSNNPTTTTRVLAFVANDGTSNSNTANKSVSITAVNDAPVVTTTGGTTAFVEDSGAVAVDSGITVTDIDSATLASATVTITNLLDAGQETLAAPTLLGAATANYVAPTLTISGAATVAEYQTMLAAVTYNNTSNNPDTTTRVINFQVNDGAGVNNLSNVGAKNVSVAQTNDPPVVTTTGGTTSFTEAAGAVTIDSGVTVTDVDGTTIASATVTISNLLDAGQETLAAPTLLGGATANYVAPTLTISGVTTLANYQAMLAAVTYNNASNAPNTTTRTINFQVNDGTSNSNLAAKSVSVTSVNSAPVVTTSGGTTAFVEDGPAVAIDGALTVTDPDTTTISSATVTISNLLDVGLETLAAPTLLGGATANYVAPTLTISGTTTVADYQAMLRAVTYSDASNTPDTTNRVINFQVDDGQSSNNLSNVASKTVSVTPANDAPVVTTSGGTTSFTEGLGAVTIDSGVTVTDVDSPTMASATVTISNLLDVGLETLAAPTLLGGATANYVAPTLTISGVTSVANYQAMLAAVTYNNGSNNPNTTTRTINFQVNDGAANSNIAGKSVSVTGVNSAPVVTTSGGATAFVEDAGAVAVDGALTVTDADSPNLTQATVTITNVQDGLLETLSAPTLLGGATANFVSPTLTISGTTTVANYQSMLAAVTYNNGSNTPNTTTRVIDFQVTDGTDPSNVASKSVTVAATNDAPIVTTTGGDTSFTEDGGAVTIDSGVTVTDADSTTIASATVTITNLLDAGMETLAAPTLLGGATANYVAPTLTISGTTTLADYQTMLAAVTYNNTSQGPTTTTRVLAFAANDGTTNSAAANKNVTITGINDAPVVTTSGGPTAFTEDGGAVVIDNGLTVSDVDSPNLSSATITISNLQNAGVEVLAIPGGSLLGGATANYVAPTLTISGVTTVANYQSMLRAVTYNNTSQEPNTTTRVIDFQVNDGAGVNNLSNTASKNVSVTSVNDAPTPNAAGPFNGQAGITVNFPAATLGGTDVESGTTVTVDTTPGTVTNGSVTLNADGSFSFTPAPGSAGGTASFQYNVCDNGNPGPGVCSTSPVTVTFNVAGPAIYFVTTGGAGTTCSQPQPCTLANAVAQIGANTNRKIFIMDNGTHNAAVPLNSQGWLIGQGVATGFADFDAVFGINPAAVSPGTLATRPLINQARPTVSSTVSLNASTAVRGLNVTTTTVVAMNDVQAGTFASPVVNDVNLSATGFAALDLSTITAASLTFGSVSANGSATAANGVILNNVAGAVAINGGALQNTTAAAISLTNTGSLTTTLSGVTINNTSVDGITGSTFGTLSVSTTTVAASTHALTLTTGAVNGTFTSVSCTPGGNNVPVTLSGVTGNFTVSGGTIGSGTGGSTPVALDIIGGTATINWNGTITQAKGAPAISITGGNAGNVTFGGASITGNVDNADILFDNADGTYNINATATTLTNGAGIEIRNGSSGNFTFNANTGVTNGLTGANSACLVINGSSPATFTYSGNLTKNAAVTGRLVDLNTIAASANPITFNTGTLSTNSTSGTSTGVLLNDVDKAVNFNGTLTLNNGDAGIDITGGSAGAITFNSSTTIGATTSPTGNGVDINNGSATTNVTYSGTVSTNAGRPVSVQNVGANSVISFGGNVATTGNGILLQTMGNPTSVTFSGTSKSLSVGANTGVTYTGAAGNTVTFSNGGLVITRSTGAGINATGGGTLVITGTGNIINNGTSGTGLLVNGVTIGVGGLVFQSISQQGGSNGVFLQNTGSTAGLSITGNSSGNCGGDADTNTGDLKVWTANAPVAADCTGGTIQNTTGADGGTAGTGIYLNNTQKVSLTRVKLNDHQNYAIAMTNVTGFTADNLYITGTNGTNTAFDEGGIWISQLAGTTAGGTNASITSSTIEGAFEHNVWMVNNGTTVLDRITFDNVTIGANALASGDDGIGIEVAGTATTRVTIDNCRFTAAAGDMFNLTVQGTNGQSDLIIDNTQFFNTHGNIVSGGGGVVINVGESGDLTYNITNNVFRGAKGSALAISKAFGGGAGNGTASGTIDNNNVGAAGVAGSASSEGSGIFLNVLGRGAHTSLVKNNTIRGYHNYGIYMLVGGSSTGITGLPAHDATFHMTIQTNNIAEPTNTWTFPQYGIHLRGGTNAGDAYAMCIDIGHDTLAGNRNTLDNSGGTVGASTGEDMFIWPRFSTTINLPGYGGGATADASVVTYLQNRNNNPGSTSVLVLRQNTAGWAGGAACNQP